MLVDRRLDGKCIHTTQGVFSGEVSGDVEVSYVAYMERESKWKRISLFWKYAGSESTLCKIDFATCDRDQKSALTPTVDRSTSALRLSSASSQHWVSGAKVKRTPEVDCEQK
jgi:hypothetical protein